MKLDRIKTLLHYCPITGQFTRLCDWYGEPKGSIVGTLLSNGYLQARVDGTKHLLHRLAWFYVHGVWPVEIDHIDGVRSNNAITNLRNVTHGENQQNMSRRGNKNNTSGHVGVSWHRTRNVWVATITVENKTVTVGESVHLDSAVQMRVDAKARFHTFAPEGRP